MSSSETRDLLREARAALERDPTNPVLKSVLESAQRLDAFVNHHNQEGARYLEAAFRSIETLATALLGLTVTFRNQLATDPVRPDLLRWCWILLATSIVAGVMHRFSWGAVHYKVAEMDPPGKPFAVAVFASGLAAWVTFIGAIVWFVRFALANFPA